MNPFENFKVEVPDSDLAALKQRLENTRWPTESPDPEWISGVPVAYLRELVDYWVTSYDWRKWEERLNAFPQFTAKIDGENVHFMHIRSQEDDAMPLVLIHGWPSTSAEFLDLIDPLVNPTRHGRDRSEAFHLVIPTLPGFGFSGPVSQAGWDGTRMAHAIAELMHRLEYQRYGVQGGDWGEYVGRELALAYPERIVGLHLNTLYTVRLPSEIPADLAPHERAIFEWRASAVPSRGYAELQSTRPQTIAFAVADSPAGQLAWIIEKFKEWTDNSGEPDEAVNIDHLLTNVTIYWLTNTGGSSGRIYYETNKSSGWPATAKSPRYKIFDRVLVPTGVANFPAENSRSIRRFAAETYNVVHWSEMTRGGHFPAMEAAGDLVADIRTFFSGLNSSSV
ncbi:epoxide hydrolase [Paenarthrobacter nitroguajacolicus]|uniref:epoxide hydrolase family protein n=1 Tax=Paenarthrobacter nitroguajacolicus TaxID=211146 RepID=UPI0015BC81C2|nr:epoxide hydrolase family protein [Paenarthrobacter nitroguajacolicus]NWL10300.1 epoxide hydrolase [Paenarthrobacter nitroguajacolicus]